MYHRDVKSGQGLKALPYGCRVVSGTPEPSGVAQAFRPADLDKPV